MKGFLYVFTLTVALATPTMCNSGGTASQAFGQDQATPETVVQVGHEGVETETAKVIIDAPTRGRVGELIRFDLTRSVADSIMWRLLPASGDFESYDEGRRAVFSARTPGDYMFIIAVAKGGTVDVITHTVHIEGPPAKPDTHSLTEWVPYWLYPMQLNREEALKLAQSFEDVAGRITAISTPKGIIEATAEANRTALGNSIEAWKPLLIKIQAALGNKAKAGTLMTPDQHKEVWLSIAKGLRKYAA